MSDPASTEQKIQVERCGIWLIKMSYGPLSYILTGEEARDLAAALTQTLQDMDIDLGYEEGEEG